MTKIVNDALKKVHRAATESSDVAPYQYIKRALRSRDDLVSNNWWKPKFCLTLLFDLVHSIAFIGVLARNEERN